MSRKFVFVTVPLLSN